MDLPKFAVIGAGCGGQTFAGYLASQGFEVRLYNRTPERLGDLPYTKRITLKGALEAEGKISTATTDIGEAVDGADIIMVVTIANGHGEVAKSMTPYLTEGQIVILNPGRTFGSLEVANEVYRQRPDLDVTICEANTLLYATRVQTTGTAQVYGVKSEVSLAALQPWKTHGVIEMIKRIFPQMVPAGSVLETSLGNIGAVFHPTIMLFNRDKIKRGEDFEFYCEGVTPEAAEFMKMMDKERIAIASSLDTAVPTLEEWLMGRYELKDIPLRELLRSNPSYQGILAPKRLDHRYFNEDVPTGLVPLSLIGHALGIMTQSIDYVIDETERTLGLDMRTQGRTLEKLGLNAENIRKELKGFVGSEDYRKVLMSARR